MTWTRDPTGLAAGSYVETVVVVSCTGFSAPGLDTRGPS